MYNDLAYYVMKSYLIYVWDKKIPNGYITLKQNLLHVCDIKFYYIPSCEILEFPSIINFDIITSDNINFHFHFLL